jgi:hypothetical protein
MKMGILMAGVFLISTAALAEVPAVQKVVITSEQGCGVPPPPGHTQVCPTVTQVRFQAETTGICDTFSITTRANSEGGTEITIEKETERNCTRPEHAPMVVDLEVSLGEVKGPITLGNPLIVTPFFRE